MPLITNVMGSTAPELCVLVAACEAQPAIAAIELNVSCPNVGTGLDIGSDPEQLERVMRAVRTSSGKPLIVKLTPNTADVAACAAAAERGGADAVSLINTLRAMALAPGSGAPWLGGRTGGLSGPAIRAVALAQVAAVAARRGAADHRHGRRAERHSRPRSAGRGRQARGSRHGELSRPARGCPHRVGDPA